ncbi:uncharacterized protein TrAFT101_007785 [Trichoderma asperellum]|uniref:uncharacterized protein n=1 Tax=Trichoderma asperellum TaxID=101201 RepID=UPI00332AB6B4|nr:hypothetical protein TrAFT101_007785 [Trichoderma asperellum]
MDERQKTKKKRSMKWNIHVIYIIRGQFQREKKISNSSLLIYSDSFRFPSLYISNILLVADFIAAAAHLDFSLFILYPGLLFRICFISSSYFPYLNAFMISEK